MSDDGESTAADPGPATPDAGPTTSPKSIRATYDEYVFAGRTVGTISDPEHGGAWLQSDVTVRVRP